MDPKEAEEALDKIDELIRRLKIDFDRFFNGALPTPPELLRFKTFAEVRKLRSEHHKSAVIRFRINSLEAKLNSMSELFNRRLRDVESGVMKIPRRPGAARRPTHDPYGGVVIDREADPRAVEALYSELYGKQGRGAKTDLESFQGFLQTQAKAIRDKTGCDNVVFRLTTKKGKLHLKAKPGR